MERRADHLRAILDDFAKGKGCLRKCWTPDMIEVYLRSILAALFANIGPEAAALGAVGASFDRMMGR
jgi:hypothetical protein